MRAVAVLVLACCLSCEARHEERAQIEDRVVLDFQRWEQCDSDRFFTMERVAYCLGLCPDDDLLARYQDLDLRIWGPGESADSFVSACERTLEQALALYDDCVAQCPKEREVGE